MEEYKEKFILVQNEDYCYRKITITKIYDGDTITVDINLGLNININNVHIRLYGINTAEIKGTEKENGEAARDLLISYLKDREIVIYTINDKKDKYGRLLGILIDKLTNENYNYKMLQNNNTKPYFI